MKRGHYLPPFFLIFVLRGELRNLSASRLKVRISLVAWLARDSTNPKSRLVGIIA